MTLRAAIVAFGLAPIPISADTLTAARVIRANAVIEANDITISDVSVPGALSASTDIAGMEARVTLYPGRPIMPGHVGPAALVLRNQPVTLIYQKGSLIIETEGRALSRGGQDDSVKVMNLASRSTVIGRVRANGTVAVHAGGIVN
ncbi:MAG: flagellar basal body P-ring formation chaperone FlgA [Pseudomonadota bacterium]